MALDWDAEEEDLYWLLVDEMSAAAALGGTAAALELARQGVPALGVAWGQINTMAANWAQEFCAQLVTQINDTSKQQIAQAISAFHATPGMTRGELERLIMQGAPDLTAIPTAKGMISATRRAEMIAVTETTRSYSAGNVEFMKSSGLTQVAPKEQPPAHVACRCAINAFPRDDGVMSWRWKTLNDDRVCEICAPKNETDVGE